MMQNTLWALGGLGFVLTRILSLKGFGGGLLSNDKSLSNSEQPPIYGVGGGLFIATGQPDLICLK